MLHNLNILIFFNVFLFKYYTNFYMYFLII